MFVVVVEGVGGGGVFEVVLVVVPVGSVGRLVVGVLGGVEYPCVRPFASVVSMMIVNTLLGATPNVG